MKYLMLILTLCLVACGNESDDKSNKNSCSGQSAEANYKGVETFDGAPKEVAKDLSSWSYIKPEGAKLLKELEINQNDFHKVKRHIGKTDKTFADLFTFSEETYTFDFDQFDSVLHSYEDHDYWTIECLDDPLPRR